MSATGGTVEVDKLVEASQNVEMGNESTQQDPVEPSDQDGAVGRRTVYLRKSLNRVIERCVKAGSFSLFVKNHPSVARKNLKALQKIHEQYQDSLKKAIDTEVDQMLPEEHIEELLNGLDSLGDEAEKKPGYTAWRPSGCPDEDLRCHLVSVKVKQKERLQKMVEGLEEENARLMRAVLPRRQSLLELEKQVEDKTLRWQNVMEDVDLTQITELILPQGASRHDSSGQAISDPSHIRSTSSQLPVQN